MRAYTQQSRKPVEHSAVRYESIKELRSSLEYRWSHDSGHGTEPDSPQASCLSLSDECDETHQAHESPDTEESNEEKRSLLGNNSANRYFSRKLKTWSFTSNWAVRLMGLLYDVTDRLILILGFVLVATGIVTYGGHFVSSTSQ